LTRLRHDRAAIAVLAGLPVVVFALPALVGLPVMPGDDHTQNFPLRVLAGAQIRHGHLPLFDPYIWSGAPLLGGWNAGAAYPLTLLFAVLPGVAAWTLNLVVTWWAAGLGSYAFLRASRLSPVASFLGALSFAFAGAMPAQIPHFGLVAGLSWVPLALLATLRLAESTGLAQRLGWLALLAGAMGLVILAGEPRAIDDAVIIVAIYAGWRAWRLRGLAAGSAFAGLVLAGAVLGVALGAVQWLPGLAVIDTSQRVAHSAFLFDSGSLARNRLLLSLVPDLLGGSGSFGQPAFLGTYSLNEMTGYVGLMPLAAACALLGRLRWRPLPEWFVWHLMALVGVLLALGGNTPLGRVLVYLPFFGDQRLQSRNIVIADLALAVLLGYWADAWLSQPREQRWRWLVPARRLLGALPGIAAVAVVLVTIAWGAGMLRWLGLSPDRAAHAWLLRPWLLPSLALGALAVVVVWWGPRLAPGRRARVLTWFVAADVTVFTLLTVVAVAPGLGGAPAPAAAAPPPASAAAPPARTRPASAFTRGGRFAVYDPGLIDGDQLSDLGVPDGNVMSQTPSIEGYTSIVDGTYATATGSHQATGEGQNVLAPRAVGDGTLDQLGTTVLFAPSGYLLTPASIAPSAPGAAGPAASGEETLARQGGAGLRELAPQQPATWYFGAPLTVTSVAIPVRAGAGTTAGRLSVRLVLPSGSAEIIATTVRAGSLVTISRAHPRQAVAVQVVSATGRAALGAPVIGTAAGARYQANGVLQDALVPPRWRFSGLDGPFAVFRDTLARPALTLRPLPGGSAAGASVRAAGGPRFAPTSARVSSPHGVTVIRAVAAIAGWTATWRPAGGDAVTVLPVRRSGLVQAVLVPAGHGTLTWAYDPPGAKLGLWVSLAALAVLGVAAGAALCRRESWG
jgi:hypothetical protein